MENFFDMLIYPLKEFWRGFVSFLPNLLVMLIILFSGGFFAWLVRKLLLRIFDLINFDKWCDRMGLTTIIRRGNIWIRPSIGFGSLVFWFFIILFLMIALTALKLEAIDNLISQIFLYIPRALSALIIIIVGYIVSGFVSRAVLIAAVNSGYHYAKILAEAVRFLLIVLILSMALEQLHIAPGIVMAAFSIIFGGIVLALAIAFGVGGIDAARRIIERSGEGKKVENKEEEDEEGKEKRKERDIEHL